MSDVKHHKPKESYVKCIENIGEENRLIKGMLYAWKSKPQAGKIRLHHHRVFYPDMYFKAIKGLEVDAPDMKSNMRCIINSKPIGLSFGKILVANVFDGTDISEDGINFYPTALFVNEKEFERI